MRDNARTPYWKVSLLVEGKKASFSLQKPFKLVDDVKQGNQNNHKTIKCMTLIFLRPDTFTKKKIPALNALILIQDFQRF